MSRHWKVEDELNELEHREYLAFLGRSPRPTVDEAYDWLAEKGYKIGRTAVWKHKKNFEQTLSDVKQAAEMARAFSQVAKESGVTGMNDAIIAKFQQLQMQWAFGQLNGGDLTPEDMERFAKSMNHMASAQKKNEELRQRFDEAMKTIQLAIEKRGDGKISAADIAEARRNIFGGTD